MIASRPFRVACVQTRPGKSNMDFICLAKPVTPSPQSPRFFIARYYSHRSCIPSVFPHLEQASPCIVYIFISKLQYPQGDMSQVKKKRKQLIVKTKEINQQQQLKVCQRVCESTRLSKKAFVASLKLPVESMSKLLGGREFQSLIVLVQKLNL